MRRLVQFTPGGIAASVLVLTVAAVCVRLGFWQLSRHQERRARNTAIAERIERSPVELESLPMDTTGLLHRRVRLHGTWDHGRSVVLPGRSHRGAPGVELLTPLRTSAGRAVLVSRGWLPSADAASVDLAAVEVTGGDSVEGVVLPLRGSGEEVAAADTDEVFPLTWYSLDMRGLPARFPYPVPPYIVQALPDGRSGYPLRLPPPELGAGTHFSYAVQWFSFAAIALGGWLILIARGAASRPRKDGSVT